VRHAHHLVPFVALLLLLRLSAVAHPGSGIAVDAQGRVFVVAGPLIVLIETNGVARRIVHDATNEKFYQLHHIRRAPDGGLLTASDMGNGIWRFTAEGRLTRFFPPENDDRALRVGLGGDPFEVDREGNIYSVNSRQDRFTQILKTSPDGQIRVLAGGEWGFADRRGEQAKFGDLHGGSFLLTSDGALLVSDGGVRVRKVTLDGQVTTLAGGAESRHVDGPREVARFVEARGLVMDALGRVLVADAGGGRIRSITAEGTVTTIAGSGAVGSANGPALEASFAGPSGIAVGTSGDVFVWEPEPSRVRKISGGRVTTILNGLP
jgi:hypothetical protein